MFGVRSLLQERQVQEREWTSCRKKLIDLNQRPAGFPTAMEVVS